MAVNLGFWLEIWEAIVDMGDYLPLDYYCIHLKSGSQLLQM